MSNGARSLRNSLLLAISILVGCRESGEQPEEKGTLCRMRLAAEILQTMIEKRYDDPFKYTSYKEALKNWKNQQKIDPTEAEMVEVDWWGNEFYWELVTGESRKAVRLMSAGNNGIREHGNNDDIWIEVEVLPDGSTKLNVKPLEHITRARHK